MKNSYIALGVIVGLVIGGFIGYISHRPGTVVRTQTYGAVGDVNATQRVATCVLDMSTTSPAFATTTTSTNSCLYNGDSKDRVITSVEYYISSLGSANTAVASTTWKMGTSTDVYNPSAGYVLNTTIATTTGNGAYAGTLFVASTSPGATGVGTSFQNYRVWPAGTNLVLYQNASSTWNATILIRYFSNN